MRMNEELRANSVPYKHTRKFSSSNVLQQGKNESLLDKSAEMKHAQMKQSHNGIVSRMRKPTALKTNNII